MPDTTYHFSLGNSSYGPIGYCARVEADSPERAVEWLRAVIQDVADGLMIAEHGDGYAGLDYAEVYFNPEQITVADIDFVIDEDGDEHSLAGVETRIDPTQAIREILGLLANPSSRELRYPDQLVSRVRAIAEATGQTADAPGAQRV